MTPFFCFFSLELEINRKFSSFTILHMLQVLASIASYITRNTLCTVYNLYLRAGDDESLIRRGKKKRADDVYSCRGIWRRRECSFRQWRESERRRKKNASANESSERESWVGRLVGQGSSSTNTHTRTRVYKSVEEPVRDADYPPTDRPPYIFLVVGRRLFLFLFFRAMTSISK